ncbi:hypothetical protein [Saccharibacillus sp. JS10]|uniref:hypothetical protein n=1 Tax=Saccharibacillus sp. JS10 TaxID=2950552 RepID=UPI00210C1155|nr:hypothetical protein [Saccharibacillus sp. JS10]MCQ4085937.1 hypothetical protein [Saccharibacillus sp. JS10]
MKKIISMIIITLLAISVLVACENKSEPESQEVVAAQAQEPASTQEAAPASEEPKKEPTIHTGVHVDWDAVNSPLWNEDIENKLKATLNAIAEQDDKKLNEEIIPDSNGAFDYILQNQYDFKKVSDVREDHGKVLVKVDHDVLMPGSDEIQSGGNYYYFEKDADDQWQLVAID